MGMWCCTDITYFIRIGWPLRELWHYVYFPRWRSAISLQVYFRFLVLWHLAFMKAKSSLHIKFRPDILIHSWDITTYGSCKTNALHAYRTRRVVVYLWTHCNIGSKRARCPLAGDVELWRASTKMTSCWAVVRSLYSGAATVATSWLTS